MTMIHPGKGYTKRKRRVYGKNRDRAEWARTGLSAFLAEVGSNGDDRESFGIDVGDFLADLMHLCDLEGVDFDAALENGRWHYEYEVEQKGDPNA